MKSKFTSILLLCFIVGCVSLGKPFSFQNVSNLKLGELKSTEYKNIFGEPTKTSIERNKDGSYEKVNYFFTSVSAFDESYRRLVLEFKNGILNGYNYVSLFNTDKTSFDEQYLSHVKIGETNQSDVIEQLGKPSGRANCPTTILGKEETCQNGDSVILWNQTKNKKYTIAYVVINQDGLISKVYLSSEN